MAESLFFYGELQQALRKTLTNRFTELYFQSGTGIPTTTDLAPGAKTLTGDILQGYGEASLLATGAEDIPLVKLSMSRDEYPTVMAVAAYDLNWQEERSLNYAGKRNMVEQNKVLFVRRAIAERLNRFAAYGDTGVNARGLLNSVFPALTDSAFNPNTAITDDATFNAFVDFMIDGVLQLGVYDYAPETQIRVVLSLNMMTKLVKARRVADPSVSVMGVVRQRLEEAGVANNITFVPRSEAAGANMQKFAGTAGKDRMCLYHIDPMVVSRSIEQQIAQLLPERYVAPKGTTLFYPMFSCASMTMIHDATRVYYVDHVAAAA